MAYLLADTDMLPPNDVALFQQSIPIKGADGTVIRWAVEQTRDGPVYHRFEPTQTGVYHWSGSTNGVTNSGQPRAVKMGDVPVADINAAQGS